MKVTAMVSIIPIGTGLSLSSYVAACERVFCERGVEAELHAHGTNIQGEWDDVVGAIRECIDTVHGMGVARISTWIKLGTRTDRAVSMEKMVESVRKKVQ
jgi:uncharacterized protein (TIGR00106 family)